MDETVKRSVLDDEQFRTAESVLREGETVVDLIDRSARAKVEYRREQAEFLARDWRRANTWPAPEFSTRPTRSLA